MSKGDIIMMINKKLLSATVLLILTASYVDFVSAHGLSGVVGKSKSGVAATDIYQVTCYDDDSGVPKALFFRVRDLRPILAPIISIRATNGSQFSELSKDIRDGDAVSSKAVFFKPENGQGTYILEVKKSGSKAPKAVKGKEIYSIEYHCLTASGDHTGTSTRMTQDQ